MRVTIRIPAEHTASTGISRTGRFYGHLNWQGLFGIARYKQVAVSRCISKNETVCFLAVAFSYVYIKIIAWLYTSVRFLFWMKHVVDQMLSLDVSEKHTADSEKAALYRILNTPAHSCCCTSPAQSCCCTSLGTCSSRIVRE